MAKDALSREFKNYLLAHLRQASGWERYYLAQERPAEWGPGRGWKGKTNCLTRDQILQACADLGVDRGALEAEYRAGHRVAPAAAVVEGEGDEGESENPLTLTPAERGALNQAIDARIEAVLNPDPDMLANAFEGQNADAIVSNLLSPLGVHLTPYLTTHLADALRPLAQAASAGPRVETKVVRAPAFNPDASGAQTVVNVVKRATLRQLFGFKKREAGTKPFDHALDNVTVPVCDYFDAPAVDKDYLWPVSFAVMLGVSDATGQNAWFGGDAGVGKTVGTTQYAALTGRPFVRVPFNKMTEPMDLLGETGMVEGKTVWKDHALTRAFRTPYCIVLLDEPCLLRSGTLAFVQTCLDTRILHLPTGEDVQCAEGVMFVVADNTLGVGDDTGRYVDAAPVNAAFLDRFSYREEIKFLEPERETEMISRRSGLAREATAHMVAYAGLTRENARSGKLTLGLTPRRLLAWSRAVVAGVASSRAFEMAVLNGSAPEDLECLRVLAETSLTQAHSAIDALARGLPAPAPITASPIADVFPHDENSIAPDPNA